MGSKNVRKTNSYITKEKIFKSVKKSVFWEYLEIKAKAKKCQG